MREVLLIQILKLIKMTQMKIDLLFFMLQKIKRDKYPVIDILKFKRISLCK